AEGMFEGFFDVLKPGGVLGVVDHRAADGMAEYDDSGYVGQDRMIALAEAAGFGFDASSEVNANPLDTKDHANGVWTLPPTNRHDEADAARYAAIGETDRMPLRFLNPEYAAPSAHRGWCALAAQGAQDLLAGAGVGGGDAHPLLLGADGAAGVGADQAVAFADIVAALEQQGLELGALGARQARIIGGPGGPEAPPAPHQCMHP